MRLYLKATLYIIWLLQGQCLVLAQTFEPSKLKIEWRLIENQYEQKNQFRAQVTICNNGKIDLPASGWRIYFNLRYHGILQSLSKPFKIIHESGDLFYITPHPGFQRLGINACADIQFTGRGKIVNRSDVPRGFYFLADGDNAVAVDLPNVVIGTLPEEHITFNLPAEEFFAANDEVKSDGENILPIVPTPHDGKTTGDIFTLGPTVQISADPACSNEAKYLADELDKLFANKSVVTPAGAQVSLRIAALLPEEYRLTISKIGILIEGGSAAGVFNGIQSLRLLIDPKFHAGRNTTIALNTIEISDKPGLQIRELMLDVARNFQSYEEILRVLDVMALYKLNVFHFHLTDDEGWRLEIPGLEELTTTGANRGYPYAQNERLHPSYGSGARGTTMSNGHYTRQQFIKILQYAKTRHIKVIPEIEMPGHARAAIKSMEVLARQARQPAAKASLSSFRLTDPDDSSKTFSAQYYYDNVMNVALPSVYTFIEKVVDEIGFMYRDAGVVFDAIHVAGDEVPEGSWEHSPVAKKFMAEHHMKSSHELERYFQDRLNKILRDRNLQVYGWQELVVRKEQAEKAQVVEGAFDKDKLTIDAWWFLSQDEELPYKIANAGYREVITCFDYFYFDLPSTQSFQEQGDGWIGSLDMKKTFSFLPFNYYATIGANTNGNASTDPSNGKEKLREENKNKIVGLQAALWGENLLSAETMEYLLLPRLLALAERAWNPEPSWVRGGKIDQELLNQDWRSFVWRLGREVPRLESKGYKLRIPPAGAIIKNNLLVANKQFENVEIRYTTDGSEPTQQSKLYTQPFAVEANGIVKLKTFTKNGLFSITTMISNRK